MNYAERESMIAKQREQKRQLEALQADYAWREVTTLPEALAATEGKTIARTFSFDEGREMYSQSGAVVIFTDGSGFALLMDEGWGGTDVTPGDPASTEYFILTARPRPTGD